MPRTCLNGRFFRIEEAVRRASTTQDPARTSMPQSNMQGANGVLGPSMIVKTSLGIRLRMYAQVPLRRVVAVRATTSARGIRSAAASAGRSPGRGRI